MIRYLLLICFLTLLDLCLHAQDPCDSYDAIVDSIEALSYSAVNSFPLAPDLRSGDLSRSRRITKQALRMAYALAENTSCTHDDNIAMSIAELEHRLGNYNKARDVLITFLKTRCPEFDNPDADCWFGQEPFEALARTMVSTKSFYQQIRKQKGIIGVCGTVFPLEWYDTANYYATTLHEHFGAMYCIRYLNAVGVILNGTDVLLLDFNNSLYPEHDFLQRTKDYLPDVWDPIYDEAILALLATDSRENLMKKYLTAPVTSTDLTLRYFDTFGFGSGYIAKYVIKVNGLRLLLCEVYVWEKEPASLLKDPREVIEGSEFLERLRN